MDARAPDLRLVSLPGDEPNPGEGPQGPAFTDADLDVARDLAAYHRLLAAELGPHSQLRGLVLRCGGHWSRLGAIPRNGLTAVERGERPD